MSDELSQKTCRFDVCCECAVNCCQGAKPPLTAKRKRIIDAYLRKHKISINPSFINQTYSFPAFDAQEYCVFHVKKTGKCLVHSVKPETCVAGPVTFDINVRTGKIEWFLKTAEACSLAKTFHQNQNQNAFQEHFCVAKKKILRLIRELDADALQAILMIEEPRTIKIGEDDVPREILKKISSERS